MSTRKITANCALLSIIFLLIINQSIAIPSLPTEFYGTIKDRNLNATPGQQIQAFDHDGKLCGTFRIVNTGFYGILTCTGDDPETSIDEGAVPGENIIFKYKGGFTSTYGNTTFIPGEYQFVKITYPVVFCGDYFCDNEFESGLTCPLDCPILNESNFLNTTTNMSMNQSDGNTTPADGSGGSGGGATGGGASQSSSRAQNNRNIVQRPTSASSNLSINDSKQSAFDFKCEENWVCGNWSKCSVDSTQNRTCIDKNKCETFDYKPPELQKCIYTPTCNDKVKNGLEQEIDCGGLCQPCTGCFDGIQNCHHESCEEEVDCGGPCKPCDTCFDNTKNCPKGICEDNTDCGGPCDKKCPEKQLPRFEFQCTKDWNPLSNDTIIFFIILIIVISSDITYSYLKIKNLKKNKQLKDIERVKKIYSVKRKMYLFILITAIVAIILYLYYFFFIMCETDYKFLWLLVILLLITPLLIHWAIKLIEYTEKKKEKKMAELEFNHKKQIESLISITQDNLESLGKEIEGGFSPQDPVLQIIKDTLDRYYKKADASEEETKLIAEYGKITNEKQEQTPAVKKLSIMIEQLKKKKELYEELKKLNQAQGASAENTTVPLQTP